MASKPKPFYPVDQSRFVDGPTNTIDAADFTIPFSQIEAALPDIGLVQVSGDDDNIKHLADAFATTGDITFTRVNTFSDEKLEANFGAGAALNVASLTASGTVSAGALTTSGNVTASDARINRVRVNPAGADGFTLEMFGTGLSFVEVSSGVATQLYVARSDGLYPQGTRDLGLTIRRWNNIYLANNPNVSSDEQGKTEMQYLRGGKALDVFRLMRFRQYTRPDDDTVRYGFAAQELAEDIRSANAMSEDELDKSEIVQQDPETGEYSVVYNAAIMVALAGMQEWLRQQEERLQEQDDRLAALESQLNVNVGGI